MPSVSVIVPNYNHARYLRQRINSVLEQTYQDFEVILLDDYSTDDSQSILLEYASDPRVRIDLNDKNSGSTFKQWNKGVRLARGRYVWMAESDDYADERFLEKLVPRLDADSDAVLCYCRSRRVSSEDASYGFWDSYLSFLDGQRWSMDFSASGPEECARYLVHCNSVQSASSVLFRRDVYWQVGGADEKLVYCGDWKTWAAMALTGGLVLHVGEPLNYCRFHDRSVTARSRRDGIEASEFLDVVGWILQRVSLPEPDRVKRCEELSHLWIPALLNRRITNKVRWAILKNARAVDKNALREFFGAGLTALHLTLARRCRSLRARFLLSL
jgi:glycosyltransferase involved in cell wall biosynthesis